MIDDRQTRERKIAAERQRREAEFQEERVRREEETRLREAQMQQQFELLRGLVERVGHRPRAREELPAREPEVKLRRLSDSNTIEAYLKTFERLMQAHDIPQERWSVKLAPHLTGKAQQAYTALSAEEAGGYDDLKTAILKRYGINEKSYRLGFRKARRGKEETHREFSICLQDLVDKWMSECEGDITKIKDKIVSEQLINTLPSAV